MKSAADFTYTRNDMVKDGELFKITITPIVGAKFQLGEVFVTMGAAGLLTTDDITHALRRHAVGDWGEKADAQVNEVGLKRQTDVMSVYGSGDSMFYVHTYLPAMEEPGTTILLPEEW